MDWETSTAPTTWPPPRTGIALWRVSDGRQSSPPVGRTVAPYRPARAAPTAAARVGLAGPESELRAANLAAAQ